MNIRAQRAIRTAAAFTAAGIMGAFQQKAAAQVSYTGLTLTQNFSGLPNTPTTPSTASTTPWVDNTSVPGWFAYESVLGGPTASGFKYFVDDGTPKPGTAGSQTLTGGIYSLGLDSNTNRALGAAGTSSSGDVTFGIEIINNTSGNLNSINVGYLGEEWFTGQVSSSLNFAYGLGGTSVTSANITAASLNFAAPTSGGAQQVNGYTAAFQQTISANIQFGTNGAWTPGEALWLSWTMPGIGKAPALGITNFSFNATNVANSRNIFWTPPNGSNAWTTNTANVNWNDGTNTTNFNNTDTVNFGNTGVGTVAVDSAGVTPTAINVSNTAGIYTFTGGSMGGASGLTKTNNGVLVLQNSNTFANLNVFGGTVSVSTDANMGATGGPVVIDNAATLQFTASATSTRSLTINSGGGNVDTGTNTVSFSSSFVNNGAFAKLGAGSLSLGGAVTSASSGATFSVTAGSVIFTQNSGTQHIVAPSTPGGFAGNLILAGSGGTLSIDGGIVDGGGNIQVLATNETLIGAAPVKGIVSTTTFDCPIILNPGNTPGSFRTYIGESTAGNTLIVTANAPISGASDVVFSNSSAGGGAGNIFLFSTSTYTGQTIINNNVAAFVQINANNSLPFDTPLTFGDGSNTANLGALDLNGFSPTFSLLATNLPNGNSTSSAQVANGIYNTNLTTQATVNIQGTATSTFNAIIGQPFFSAPTNGATTNNNIALTLTASNTGTLILTAANNYTGTTTINGGTLDIENVSGTNTVFAGLSALPTGNNVVNNANFINNATSTVAGAISGTGTTTIGASGGLTASSFTQGALANNGTATLNGIGTIGTVSGTGSLVIGDGVGGTATVSVNALTQAALTINGASTLVLAHNATPAAAVLGALTVNNGGTLDLTNNGVVLNYSGTSPLAGIAALIQSGQNGGTWNGTGITSATVAASPTKYGIGYAEATQQFPSGGTFLGQSVGGSNTAVLARATYIGDTTLDGTVTNADIRQIILHGKYNNPNATNVTWADGDFNGDGVVNAADIRMIILSGNYNSGATFSATPGVQPAITLTSGGSANPDTTTLGVKGDGKLDYVYTPSTGDVTLNEDGVANIGELDIKSASGKFIVANSNIHNSGFDTASSTEIDGFNNFNNFPDQFDLGNILPTNLSNTTLLSDLTLLYSVNGGGSQATADLVVTSTPEPTSLALLAAGAGVLIARPRRRPRKMTNIT